MPGTINTVAKLSDQTNDTVSHANVEDLSFEVGANIDYQAQWTLVVSSASAVVGVQLAINGPASPTELTYTVTSFTSVGTPTVVNSSTYDAGLDSTTAPAGAARVQATIRATIRNGANAGVVAVRFRSSSAGVAVKVHAGSLLVYNTP